MTKMILSPFSENITADGSNNLVSSNPTGAGGAPLAPTNFTASYLSDTSLSLAWTDNATNELNFELDRSPNGTDTWTALTSPAANATSATNTGLTVDTQYFYRLRAVNAAGNSSYTTANGTTTASSAFWVSSNVAAIKAGSVYADPSITDGNGTGTIGDPYSLRGAVYNSVLGAEIIMRGGTYTLTNALYTDSDYRDSTNSFGVDWTSTDVNNPVGANPKLVTMSAAKPANESERITFRSYPGERAIVNCSGHDQFWLVDNTEYYTLEYFSLINVYIGPQIGRQAQSFYNTIQHFDIVMDREASGGDNTGGVMQYGFRGDHLTVADGKIVGPGSGVNINTSCVYVRGSNFTTIEDCNLSAAPRTIYGKHPNDPSGVTVTSTIRNCFIDGNIDTSLNEWDITNNIITGDITLTDNGGTGVNGTTGTDSNTITDNTVIGSIILSSSDNFAQLNNVDNNVCLDMDILRFQTAVASTNTSNYNLFNDIVNYQNSTLDLAAWQGTLSQDANSIAGVPTFVTVPPVTIADHALAGGSLGKGTGRSGADMGAIVANIGAPA
tara:strand:+ start:447 stop:2108 length:1662 start_codon:yes stop_codon:yes gene_type:complete